MSNPFPNFNPLGNRGPGGPVFQDPFIAAVAGMPQYQQNNRGHQHHHHPHHHHHHQPHYHSHPTCSCSMGACLSKPPPPPPKSYLHDPFNGFYGGGRELPSGWGGTNRPSEDSSRTSSTGATVGGETTRPAFVPGMTPPKSPGRTVRFDLPSENAPSQRNNGLPFTPEDPFPPRPGSAQSQPQYAPNLSFEPLDPFPPRSQPGGKKSARDPLSGWLSNTIDRAAFIRSRLEEMTSAVAPYAEARTLDFVKQLCAKPDTCAIVVEVFKSQITLGGIQATKAVWYLPALTVPAIAQFVPELTKLLKDAEEWYAETVAALRDRAVAAQAAVANNDEANFNHYLAAVGRAPQRGRGGRQSYGGYHFHGQYAPMPGAYPWM
ncbi:uncharacterized protein LOC62_01G001304 [Vanrija pseudolonga]|uniref:Uncharacterized protein n=1 Tax=Vanrija pseudolonga TaxID=143232 RepID=A0AAF0Y453_9TREE|nr:hypothetical protein LOC62_01G001304 [Vanrija pseudolonga]